MPDKFEIKKPQKQIISLRLDTSLLTQLDDIAYKAQIARNQIIIQCIHFALNNYFSADN